MGKRRWVTSLVALGTLFFFTNLEAAHADDVAWLASHESGACTASAVSGNGGGGCGFLGWGCISRFLSTARGLFTSSGVAIGLGVAALVGFGLLGLPFVIAAGMMVGALALVGVEGGALWYQSSRGGVLP